MVELLPSILSADFAHLADEIAAAERGGGTAIHVDIMDGHFVPNMTIGPPVVASIRKVTRLPLDCHLMIDNPNDYIAAFADAGANWVSVHYEACPHLHRSLELILHHGMKPGVVLNPATRVELIIEILPMVHHVLIMSVNPGFGGQEFIPFSLDKIRRLAEIRQRTRPGIQDRGGRRRGSRHGRRNRPSRSGAAGGRERRLRRRAAGTRCSRTAGRGPRGRRPDDDEHSTGRKE